MSLTCEHSWTLEALLLVSTPIQYSSSVRISIISRSKPAYDRVLPDDELEALVSSQDVSVTKDPIQGDLGVDAGLSKSLKSVRRNVAFPAMNSYIGRKDTAWGMGRGNMIRACPAIVGPHYSLGLLIG